MYIRQWEQPKTILNRRKEGINWVLRHFLKSLSHIATRLEPQNRGEMPLSSRIVSTTFFSCNSSKTQHIYIATRPTRSGIQRSLDPANSRLGAWHGNHLTTANPSFRLENCSSYCNMSNMRRNWPQMSRRLTLLIHLQHDPLDHSYSNMRHTR